VSKHNEKPAAPSVADLKMRLERSRSEGRLQQSLELAKQVYAAEQTRANLDVLKAIYVQRAEQLRQMGQLRDAATVLEVASCYDDHDPAWLSQLAEQMALCGDSKKLEVLLARLKQLPGAAQPQPARSPSAEQGQAKPIVEQLDAKLQASLVDAAFLQDKAGRNRLPAALQPDYDRIVQAFAHLEQGQDEIVRELLQPIGLRSPYADWKLLLRGLLAYYHNDDLRACENWQRLDPARVPARLAAPFRAEIDPEYRNAQTQPAQKALQEQLQRLQSQPIDSRIAPLAKALSNKDSLASAMQIVEAILPELRVSAPQLVKRLAACFYWGIRDTSSQDLHVYTRVFGRMDDDQEFNRLRAFALEQQDDWAGAHQAWADYEKEIAQNSRNWPERQGLLARALIWQRMGDNAASLPNAKQRQQLPPFLRALSGLPEPLHPDAAACYTRALQLAPDLLEAHEGLFNYYLNDENEAAALQAGMALLQQFPNHVETLEKLADLHLKKKRYAPALDLLQRALQHHPLDRQLRERLSDCQLSQAQYLAVQGQLDAARPHYQSSLSYCEPTHQWSILCSWATCEIKAGNSSRAEELLAEVRAKGTDNRLVSYALLVDATRLDLPNPIKTRYRKEFNTEIAKPLTPAVALALVEYAARLVRLDVSYYGQQTHTKKIVTQATQLDSMAYTEDQFRDLLTALYRLELPARTYKRLCRHGQETYPANPYFHYLEAVYEMGDRPDECGPVWQIEQCLAEAERRARARPREEPGIDDLLKDIARRRRMIRSLNPFIGAFMDAAFNSFDFSSEDEDF